VEGEETAIGRQGERDGGDGSVGNMACSLAG
jgi:hypothetical protein